MGDKERIFQVDPEGKAVEADAASEPDERLSRRALEEMSFSTHVLSLNATALMYLGELDGVPDEERDPDAARHLIETLAMLRVKTAGNLTLEETELLEAVLHDLRLKALQHRA